MAITPERSSHPVTRRSVSIPPCLLVIPMLLWLALATVSAQAGGEQPYPAQSSSPKRSKEPPYALIFGTVWGPDNRPIYGVRVKIRRADQKKAKWEVYSDHAGEFAQRVPAGAHDYVLWVDAKAFKSLDGKKLTGGTEVTVHVDNEERVDTSLHLTQYKPK